MDIFRCCYLHQRQMKNCHWQFLHLLKNPRELLIIFDPKGRRECCCWSFLFSDLKLLQLKHSTCESHSPLMVVYEKLELLRRLSPQAILLRKVERNFSDEKETSSLCLHIIIHCVSAAPFSRDIDHALNCSALLGNRRDDAYVFPTHLLVRGW